MKTTSDVPRWAAGALFLAVVGASACGSTDSSGDSRAHECSMPNDLGAGFEGCDGGWFHRAAVQECVETPESYCGPGCESNPSCGTNAVCTAVPYAGCHCLTTCKSDADCEPGNVCACGGTSGMCVQASCSSDADCSEGLHCASYSSLSTCGVGIIQNGVLMGGFACQSSADTCSGDGDCPSGQRCTLENGARLCKDPLPCSS